MSKVRVKKRGPVWETCIGSGLSLLAVAAVASACHAHAAKGSLPKEPAEVTVPIVELGASTNALYARSSKGRLYRWNPVTGEAKLFNQEGFVALAHDGSLAVTHRNLEPRGSRVEVWDLESDRLLGTRVFENGAGSFFVVHGAVLLVESAPPSPPRPEMHVGFPSIIIPPDVYTTLWDLQTDQLKKGCRVEPNFPIDCRFSPVGSQMACANGRGLLLNELGHPDGAVWITLAPEWIPKKPLKNEVLSYPRKPQTDPPWTFWESLAWTGDGKEIILAYARASDPPECRLERWTPGHWARADKGLGRLATVHGRCSIEVLAASRDGKLAVTGEHGHLVMRRAPKYKALEIAPVVATQAAFLPGDDRFVTLHRDGYLQLWATGSLELLATWRP
jgi:hypothetical protein